MKPTLGSVRQPALVAAAALAILALATPARAGSHDQFPLHSGSAGPRVAALQWLLGGHRPNVFTQVKPVFKRTVNGYYGAYTKHAVLVYKFRIGYPKAGQCGAKTTLLRDTTTRYFFYILEGKAKRSACWVALAAARVKAVNPGPSAAALRIRAYELQLLNRGIHEVPDSSNRGPCISVSCGSVPALQSATGAYGLAWCVSTQQTIFKLLGYGTFAGDTAGVYATVDFYAALNRDFAKAKVGALVAFIDYDSRGVRIPGTGHMGFVTDVYASSFTYTAGNDGNAYRKHTIPMGSRSYVFIYPKDVA